MSANYIIQLDARQLHEKITKRLINCICTDPPYGMKFESNMGTSQLAKEVAQPIENDGDLDTALQVFTDTMTPLLPKCADDCDVYVFTRWDLMQPWKACMEELGLSVPVQLIWNKADPGMGDLTIWGCGYEVILFGQKGHRPINGPRRGAVITHDKVPPGKMIHPTEKPVGLIEMLLAQSTKEGDFVVDPFSGSGAVSVAARNMGRDSLACDLKEKYVRIGNERLNSGGLF